MRIQKYKAKIADSKKEVVGYITEIREYLGNGSYGTGTDYLISVTEKSMPNGNYGTFKVLKESIEPLFEIDKCKHIDTYPINRFGDSQCFNCGKIISHLDY